MLQQNVKNLKNQEIDALYFEAFKIERDGMNNIIKSSRNPTPLPS